MFVFPVVCGDYFTSHSVNIPTNRPMQLFLKHMIKMNELNTGKSNGNIGLIIFLSFFLQKSFNDRAKLLILFVH